jgi:uncharacterized membrane protein (Fun14 family)
MSSFLIAIIFVALGIGFVIGWIVGWATRHKEAIENEKDEF